MNTSLARKLRLGDAVFIGLGSMIGAGVFAVWSPAAAVAGSWLLLGLALAVLAAFANATSSAQLAAQFPTSGGTYVYGREMLGEWPGFLAGWGFVIGKTASCAAIALTVGAYLAPDLPLVQRIIAIAVVLILATVNAFGVTRTARLTRIIVVIVLVVLAYVVVVNLFAPGAPPVPAGAAIGPVGPYQVLQSAGLLFFAFAGYARIATMGEEVIDPQRTIPRAIVIALLGASVVYAVVAVVLLTRLGPDLLASTTAPLELSVRVAGLTGLWPLLVAVGAAVAATGALLNLMTGIGRTSLAMARHGDLPRALAHVDPKYQVPRRAELLLALVLCVLVAFTDLRSVIGFSSFGVLLYYTVANLAALRQRGEHRRYPRWLQVGGAALCILLVVTLPWQSVVAGLVMYALGVAYRALATRRVTAP